MKGKQLDLFADTLEKLAHAEAAVAATAPLPPEVDAATAVVAASPKSDKRAVQGLILTALMYGDIGPLAIAWFNTTGRAEKEPFYQVLRAMTFAERAKLAALAQDYGTASGVALRDTLASIDETVRKSEVSVSALKPADLFRAEPERVAARVPAPAGLIAAGTAKLIRDVKWKDGTIMTSGNVVSVSYDPDQPERIFLTLPGGTPHKMALGAAKNYLDKLPKAPRGKDAMPSPGDAKLALENALRGVGLRQNHRAHCAYHPNVPSSKGADERVRIDLRDKSARVEVRLPSGGWMGVSEVIYYGELARRGEAHIRKLAEAIKKDMVSRMERQ